MSKFSIKGDIVFTKNPKKFEIYENAYLNIENDKIISIEKEQKKAFEEIIDNTGKLIIPGFVDTHVHAPQINNIGLGYDKELLQWLDTYTFPEESKYKEKEFADKSYTSFVDKLLKNGTTSSVIFGTIYKDTDILLAEKIEQKGLRAYVGKVNMDRNSPDFYVEETEKSIEDTIEFIEKLSKFKNVKPIITPRFVPSCTEKLMKKLGEIAEKYDLKIQSHISENRSEVEWIKELHKDCKNYFSVYEKYSLIRDNLNTVMAHAVWLTEEENQKMIDKKVMVSHCPYSNANLASGIAPISKMLERGFKVGLGSDISGGSEMFMARVVTLAVMLSKMYYVHIDEKSKPLTTSEVFYLATKGGGEFFGNVGSFEKDYKADVLVIDDEELKDTNSRTIQERLERFLYTSDVNTIKNVYVNGNKIK